VSKLNDSTLISTPVLAGLFGGWFLLQVAISSSSSSSSSSSVSVSRSSSSSASEERLVCGNS